MNQLMGKPIFITCLCLGVITAFSQTTNTYNTATTWTVPGGVSTITIKVWGGGGGTGGKDCGAGCTNAAAGPVGYVAANFSVSAGNIIYVYPGGKGGDGTNNISGSGGGTAGVSTYNSAYNGGSGGNAGSSGSSGGGGGGGAASVVKLNSTIVIVAGGAGGGGGMANLANSATGGNSSYSPNGTLNAGGNGIQPGGDGGGSGGGGGGHYGGIAGGNHPAGGETAGDGGYLGGNLISGASSTISNTSTAWTNAGQIQITYTSTLPVIWQSFTAIKQNGEIQLKWVTATERNTKEYIIERSTVGSNWNTIGIVTAAGNSSSTQQYSFTDKNPVGALNYYRLQQRDIDNKINYSEVVVVNFSEAAGLLRIYPNPALNGYFTLILKEASIVTVYNSTGTKILQKELSVGTHPFNLSQLAKGTYYIKAKNDAILFVIE